MTEREREREPASYANTDEEARRASEDLRSPPDPDRAVEADPVADVQYGGENPEDARQMQAETPDSLPDPAGERHAPAGLEEIESHPGSDDEI